MRSLPTGDMYIVNDPYKGAVHHPDVSIMAPLFFEGRLVAWAGVTAHQVDMGGMAVGSVSVRATEKQQEGLMMPPMRIIEKGKLRKDVWRMIMNMTRQPYRWSAWISAASSPPTWSPGTG